MMEYILIDYENVQPDDMELVHGAGCKVKVFLGPHQSRISRKVATVLQKLCADGEYVEVAKSGRNAVDFHIAFYLGTLSCQEPTGSYFIVSKDAGFDPLIEHLQGAGVQARRVERISEILSFSKSIHEKGALIEEAILDLTRRKENKPMTSKTLAKALRNRFKLSVPAGQELVQALSERGVVTATKEGKVSYNLPQQ